MALVGRAIVPPSSHGRADAAKAKELALRGYDLERAGEIAGGCTEFGAKFTFNPARAPVVGGDEPELSQDGQRTPAEEQDAAPVPAPAPPSAPAPAPAPPSEPAPDPQATAAFFDNNSATNSVV